MIEPDLPKQGPDPGQVPFVEVPGSPKLYCGIGSRAIRTVLLDSMRLDDFRRLTLGQSLSFDPSMRAVSVRSLGPILDSDGQPVPAIYGQQITVEVEYRHVAEKGAQS
jgi:hypothetical protein